MQGTAFPSSLSAGRPRLEALESRIRAIERTPSVGSAQAPGGNGAWTFGADALDSRLAPDGLEPDAVHEVKPALPETGAGASAAWAAAHLFVLALSVRRLQAAMPHRGSAPMLWCASPALTRELGNLYGPGLRGLGLDPARVLIAEPAKTPDVMWTIEEGLKSESLALVFALIEEVGLTPARRLALAAARYGTPCLLLTHPRTGPAPATATRWRVGPALSAPHPFDAAAPGAPRFSIALERCRARPPLTDAVSLDLEWCNEAYRFRVAAAVADRTDGVDRPRQRAR